ncbi:MAG: GerMN domain-containing protein [Leptospiraceae bacterium]|nr:GerMN domain-containing protein [Leptospiraceae bacterium]MCP5511994.1 GerMN domain-containing protein [Leptospiraceae bacterium]
MNGEQKPILNYLIILLIILVFVEKSISGKLTLGNKIPSIPEEATHYSSSFELPEIEDSFFPGIQKKKDVEQLNSEKTGYHVYFLKFYGSGNRTHSKLVRVKRTLEGSLKDKVIQILDELSKGPGESELSRGAVNGFPNGLNFKKKIRFEKGIMHINLPEEFRSGNTYELMMDRLDQLTYTLFEFPEIRGIVLYENNQKISSLAGGLIPIPSVIRKKNIRKVVNIRSKQK